jgi:hypothetical protein
MLRQEWRLPWTSETEVFALLYSSASPGRSLFNEFIAFRPDNRIVISVTWIHQDLIILYFMSINAYVLSLQTSEVGVPLASFNVKSWNFVHW